MSLESWTTILLFLCHCFPGCLCTSCTHIHLNTWIPQYTSHNHSVMFVWMLLCVSALISFDRASKCHLLFQQNKLNSGEHFIQKGSFRTLGVRRTQLQFRVIIAMNKISARLPHSSVYAVSLHMWHWFDGLCGIRKETSHHCCLSSKWEHLRSFKLPLILIASSWTDVFCFWIV